MHYFLSVAVAFLCLFNISGLIASGCKKASTNKTCKLIHPKTRFGKPPALAASEAFQKRSAPSHGFLTRIDSGDIQNERSWGEVVPSGILTPEREESSEAKFTSNSNENDRESIPRGYQQKESRNNYQQQSRQNPMNLANFATLLSSPDDLESSIGDGRKDYDLWAALDKIYHGESATGNFHPILKSARGHTLLPQLTEKMDTYALNKRSPDCLRKCLRQGLLHPGQCHSLC